MGLFRAVFCPQIGHTIAASGGSWCNANPRPHIAAAVALAVLPPLLFLSACAEGQLGRNPEQFLGKCVEGSFGEEKTNDVEPISIARVKDNGEIIIYKRVDDSVSTMPRNAGGLQREFP